MSAGNLGGGVSIPFGIDESGVDAGLASILRKYQAARAELAKPFQLNVGDQGGGGAVFGMDAAQRAASGASNPSQWRTQVAEWKIQMNTATTGTAAILGGAAAAIAGPQGNTALPLGGGQNFLAYNGAQMIGGGGGRVIPPGVNPVPSGGGQGGGQGGGNQGSGFRLSARFAAFFAAAGIGEALGAAQDIHANNFLNQYRTHSEQADRVMSSAESNMGGFSGMARRFLSSDSYLDRQFKALGIDFDEQGKYLAGRNASLGVQQVNINTAATSEIRQRQADIERRTSLLPNINQRDPNVAANREAGVEATFQRSQLTQERNTLNQQLQDARSQNDKQAEQQIRGRLRVLDATEPAARKLIGDTESRELSESVRNEAFYQFRTGLALKGTARSLRDDIAHPRNPIFGNIDDTLTSGEDQIAKFQQDRQPRFAEEARQNLQLSIKAMERRWAAGLQGGSLPLTEIGRLFANNTTEDPSEIFAKFGRAANEARNFNAPIADNTPPLKLDQATIDAIGRAMAEAIRSQMAN